MLTYYIATRLENYKKHNEVKQALDNVGAVCTYDWTLHGPVWRDGVRRIREVSELEMRAVCKADFVVVILPGGRGTHVELGAAIAAGKTVFILAEDVGSITMVCEAVPETCAFYHHPNCIRVFSIPHLLGYVEAEAALKRCNGGNKDT